MSNLIVIEIDPGNFRRVSAKFLKASEIGSSCQMINSDIISSNCFVVFFLQSLKHANEGKKEGSFHIDCLTTEYDMIRTLVTKWNMSS